MAKFLFVVFPALGHINPTLSVAVELKKRGHVVGYATGEDFRYSITSESLEFFPYGKPGLRSEISKTEQKVLKHKGLLCNYYLFKALAENNVKAVDDLRLIVETFKPDVIVSDSFTHVGAQMAECFHLPWATFCSVPGLIPTRDAPPFTSWGLPPSDNYIIKKIYSVIRVGQSIFFRIFDRQFNRIRTSMGLKPLKRCALESTLSPYLMLIPTSEGFEYKRSDWPDQLHLIGPSPWGKNIDNDSGSDWIDSLPEDKPLVYVTLGTVHTFRTLNFFDVVIEALKDEPYNVVMSVGHAVDMSEFKDLPDNFRVERFVPHARILPRCTAVIHHGGLGIAQDSIYHGLPSVVVPISQDLYELARRCTSAGVAERIPYPRLNQNRLRRAVKEILTRDRVRKNTEKLRSVFLGTNAGSTGAELLEQLAETGRPVYRS